MMPLQLHPNTKTRFGDKLLGVLEGNEYSNTHNRLSLQSKVYELGGRWLLDRRQAFPPATKPYSHIPSAHIPPCVTSVEVMNIPG